MTFIFLRLVILLIVFALTETFRSHESASDSAGADDSPSFPVAVEKGHTRAVRRLLAAGAQVDQPLAYGGTALHVAAAQNNVPLAKVLLDAGADVRATNEYLSTPLMVAAANGARKCAQLLLDHGAQINAVDRYGHSPIARAIQRGQLDMLDFLAERGADLAATDNAGRNLLHLAAAQDNAEAIRWCIRQNLSVDALQDGGCSALYLAARHVRTNAVLALLEAGADPNLATTNELWTPLMAAARYDDQPGTVRQLIAAGAELERRTRTGMTALLLAACGTSTETIDVLLDAGARADVFAERGDGVLRMAEDSTNLAVFAHFLARGVDPNLAPTNAWPVIDNLAWDGRVDFLDALLAAGADPNLATPDGQTPLYVAARRSHPDFVARLLAAGADPALRRNEEFLTPWHLAILHGQPEMAEQLAARMTPEQMAPTHLVRAYLDIDAPLATNVFVAGLFNEWDATATPMARRLDDGWWYVELDLFPGLYGYKFVVDGNWIEDPLAEKSCRDGNRNTDNSMLDPELRRIETRPVRPVSSFASLVPIRFEYRDRAARYVAVAGEFNGWNADNHQLSLEKVGLWSAELRVPSGEYAYKFVVDGKWHLDPANPMTKVVDGATNSLAIAPLP